MRHSFLCHKTLDRSDVGSLTDVGCSVWTQLLSGLSERSGRVSSLWSLLERIGRVQSGSAGNLQVTIAGDLHMANQASKLPFTVNGEISGPWPGS
ncbi:MAG: hypothetical protein HY308_03210 [Gammaproteobacteria bacterium]|nr:hypothetical protein [Gammaproteobacteria bacterium]